MPLRSRGELVRAVKPERQDEIKAKERAADAERERDHVRIAADLARIAAEVSGPDAKDCSQNNMVSVGVICPRAGAAPQPQADSNLFLTGDGVLYDRETGEIVDELPPGWAEADPPDQSDEASGYSEEWREAA